LEYSGGRITYGEIDQLADATAQHLVYGGITEGERVAICMQNDWRYVVLLAALLRARAVACPMSTRLPGAALQDRMERLGCRVLITIDGSRPHGMDSDRMIWSAEKVVVMFSPSTAYQPIARYGLDQPATIIWTSGSGGTPRAVLHTVANHYYSALGANRNLRLHTGDRWLTSLPLDHVGGMAVVFRCWLAGATIVMPDPGRALGDMVADCHPTHLSVVGTQLQRLLLQHPAWDSQSLPRVVLAGGGPMPPALMEAARKGRWPIYRTYGLTEMASQVTAVRPDSPPQKRWSTAGVALRHREIRIAASGEIEVRGQTRFRGYVEDGDLVTPFDEEGWYATGDIGCLDEEGYLTVVGRKDAMFISGGENIQPEEIEQALEGIAGIEQAVVVPIADDEYGQRPAAFVRAVNGAFDAAALAASLESILPRFKIPDAFYPWPVVDDGPDLKPDRCRLAELAARQSARF
jgi:O-succinylbenzoic acid--CoA ligase